jgi:cephalosporin hydroxylase
MENNNLTLIGNKHTTDKGTIHYEAHGYTEIYGKYISDKIPCKLLEIGIWHGDSIRMWNEYNPNIDLYAVDIDPNIHNYMNGNEHFKFYLGDQSDEKLIINILNDSQNGIDFVIDDGSHNHDDILNTFKFLFPRMKSGSVYFIEDLHAGHAFKDKLIGNLFLEISKNNIKLSECEFFCNGKLLMFKKL